MEAYTKIILSPLGAERGLTRTKKYTFDFLEKYVGWSAGVTDNHGPPTMDRSMFNLEPTNIT